MARSKSLFLLAIFSLVVIQVAGMVCTGKFGHQTPKSLSLDSHTRTRTTLQTFPSPSPSLKTLHPAKPLYKNTSS